MMFVVIRDMSAGNDSVGEMWQETKIFDDETSIKTVMAWAEGMDGRGEARDPGHSRKRITITRPDNDQLPKP